MLLSALWVSLAGPLIGDWIGIIYFITYAESQGVLSDAATWIFFAVYMVLTITILFLELGLAPSAQHWINFAPFDISIDEELEEELN